MKVRRYAKGDGEGETRKFDVKLEPQEEPKQDALQMSRLQMHLAKQRMEGFLLEDVNVKDIRVQAGEDGLWRPERRPEKTEGQPADAIDYHPVDAFVERDVRFDSTLRWGWLSALR